MMKWMVTGDTHGEFSRFYNLPQEVKDDPEVGIIILGDAGWNFFLNKTDYKKKRDFHNNYKFSVYCVRGNHEARPQDVVGNMILIWDVNVGGYVYMEAEFPQIKYFMDYGYYNLSGLRTLVLGGAYSVDKWYRLARSGIIDETENNPRLTGWWANEQLTEEEMRGAALVAESHDWDLILSHTCPISWEPTDLFLSAVDQSSVDTTMEVWMEDKIKNNSEVFWRIWLFGHFHDDRLVRPHVEMFFKDVENLDDILNRWEYWDTNNELDAWWYHKDPNFYMEN